MVLLTITPSARAAAEEYLRLQKGSVENDPASVEQKLGNLSGIELGNPIDHADLIEISKFLVDYTRQGHGDVVAKQWRLETLLKGASVYQAPPPPKPEPSSEYKALMQRLRYDEERRQYERMVNPPPPLETFDQRFPNAASNAFLGSNGPNDEVDEVTYADVNRQMALIINVLVSIIACSVAIWIAARHWAVPQRLGLSMSGSGLVAAAEVAIYMGYIRRVKDAKGLEAKNVERKEIVETWVLDGKTVSEKPSEDQSIRHRKGKHR